MKYSPVFNLPPGAAGLWPIIEKEPQDLARAVSRNWIHFDLDYSNGRSPSCPAGLVLLVPANSVTVLVGDGTASGHAPLPVVKVPPPSSFFRRFC